MTHNRFSQINLGRLARIFTYGSGIASSATVLFTLVLMVSYGEVVPWFESNGIIVFCEVIFCAASLFGCFYYALKEVGIDV